IYSGGAVVYTYTVENTGSDAITETLVTDDSCEPVNYVGGDTNVDEWLDVGETWEYTCTTTLDEDTTNIATVTGEDGLGNPVPEDQASADVDVINPGIRVEKSADAKEVEVGGGVTYSYIVTNPGDDPLDPVVMADNACTPVNGPNPAEDINGNGALDPGEVWSYDCTTNLSLDTTNVVTATGTDSVGGPVTDTSSAFVDVVDPAIVITKTVVPTVTLAGGLVEYQYEVGNAGDVPLVHVNLSDNKCWPNSYVGGDDDDDGLLDVDETWQYLCVTAVWTDTLNTALVNGKPSSEAGDPLEGIPPVNASDTAEVTVVDPAIGIEKGPDATLVYSGTAVTYVYSVTNEGDVALFVSKNADEDVSDDKCSPVTYFGGDDSPDNGLLDLGETWVFQCTSAPLTQDVLNTATAVGDPQLPGMSPVSDEATAFVEVIDPAIEIVKTASEDTVLPGTSVTYLFEVTNIGDGALTSVSVTDTLCAPITLVSNDGNGQLDPGETWVYVCSQALTEDTTNVATVTAEDPLGNPVEDDATELVDVIIAGLSIEKEVDEPVIYSGGTVVYTYTVENTGTDAITETLVTDDSCAQVFYAGGDTNADDWLDVGESWTYTCTTTLDEDTTNVATVTGEDGLGNPVPEDQASADVDVINPGIRVVKSVDRTEVEVGGAVTYSYIVTNPGDDPLEPVVVEDDKCTTVNGPDLDEDINGNGALDPGEVWSYDCSTNLSVDTTNVVTATGTDSLGGTVDDTDSEEVEVVDPAIVITKTAVPTYTVSGGLVEYTYEVDNAGDVPLVHVQVSDDTCRPASLESGDADNDGILDVDETWLYTCVTVVTTDTTNTAWTSGRPSDETGDPLPGIDPVSDSDTEDVVVVRPAIVLDKEPSATLVYSGTSVTYYYTVTNGGDVPLFVAKDPDGGVSDDECSPVLFTGGDDSLNNGLLDLGETWTYECAAGSLTADVLNTAEVEGDAQLPGIDPVSSVDTAYVDVINPAIDIAKSASTATAEPGDVVVYTYVVSNTGDSPLFDVVVSDDRCEPLIQLSGDTRLDPGETWAYQCFYTVQTGDPDPIVNTVTVTSRDELDGEVSDTDQASVGVVTGLVDGTVYIDEDGDGIYTSGTDTPLVGVGVVITDSLGMTYTLTTDGSGYFSQIVPPGNAIVDVDDADLDPALALTTGSTDPTTVFVPPGSSTTDDTGYVYLQPELEVTKVLVDPSSGVAVVGDTVTFTLRIENSGQTVIQDLVVTDTWEACMTLTSADPPTDTQSAGEATWSFGGLGLALGASQEISVDFRVNTSDPGCLNTVTVSATDEYGEPFGPVEASDSVRIIDPAIVVTKTAEPEVIVAGDAVVYTYEVHNPGDAPLTHVNVVDDQCAGPGRVSADSNGLLDPGETWLYRCVQLSVTTDVTNTVTVDGQPSDDSGVPLENVDPVSDSDQAFVDVVDPQIDMVKVVVPTTIRPGEEVTYTYTVTNPGDVYLSDVNPISDDPECVALTGPGGDNGDGLLAPAGAETWVYSCTTTLVEDTTNVATATGQPSDAGGNAYLNIEPVSESDTADVDVIRPEIHLEKSAESELIDPGEAVTYTYEVTNPGDDPLSDVDVTDDPWCSPVDGPAQGGDVNDDGLLDPGETWVYSCTTTVTTDTVNVATAVGTDSLDEEQNDEDDAFVDVIIAGIQLEKGASASVVYPPASVTYAYTVTNTGADPLSDVQVVDNYCESPAYQSGDTSGDGLLDVSETWLYSCTATVEEDTINTALATGLDPLARPLNDMAAAEVNVINPGIRVEKSADQTVVLSGTDVVYTYEVTNPGDDPLAAVEVSDTHCAEVSGPAAGGDVNSSGLLDAGETWVYSCTATIEVDTENTASATGEDSLGNEVGPATDVAEVDVIDPEIDVVKSVDHSVVLPGDMVQYTYLVSNTGDVPLSDVWVVDDKCAPVGYETGDDGDFLLAPNGGELWQYSCVAMVLTDTLNTVTASGQPSGDNGAALPGIARVRDQDSESVEVVSPAIGIEKVVWPAIIGAGEEVTYTYTVTNPGDVYLKDVDPISDDPECVPITGPDGDNGDGLLAPLGAETWVYSCTTTLVEDTTNVATATGQPSDAVGNAYLNIEPVSESDTADVDVIRPAIHLEKVGEPALIDPGEVVTYTYEVTNPGDDPLSNVGVTDDPWCSPVTGEAPGGDANDDDLLDPGETWVYTCTTTVTTDTVNVATATGDDSLGSPVSDDDDAFVDVIVAGIQLEKGASASVVYPGTSVTYAYTVTNTGADPLSDVQVVDNYCESPVYGSGDTNGDELLDVDETWLYSCEAVVEEDTINTALATGLDPLARPLNDMAAAEVNVIRAAIRVVKSAEPTVVLSGTEVVYTYDVTNPGDDPLAA
ncbi:hypothetical protein ACFLWA_10985, partial [Chloroflexota bacterium]